MNLSLLFLMCGSFVIVCSQGTVDIFEFGEDDGRGRIVYNKAGFIEKDWRSKLTKVPIIIPMCMLLYYVRVEVDNPKGPPHVSLDRNVMAITIKYRSNQYSTSSYLVTAKAKPIRDCTVYDLK